MLYKFGLSLEVTLHGEHSTLPGSQSQHLRTLNHSSVQSMWLRHMRSEAGSLFREIISQRHGAVSRSTPQDVLSEAKLRRMYSSARFSFWYDQKIRPGLVALMLPSYCLTGVVINLFLIRLNV